MRCGKEQGALDGALHEERPAKKKKAGLLSNIWVKRVVLMLLDAACVFAAYLATLTFRFGGAVPQEYWEIFVSSILYIILIYLSVNALLRLYASLWEHASIEELVKIIFASIASTVLSYTLAAIRMERMPRSIYIAAGLIIILLHGGLRLAYRVLRRFRNSIFHMPHTKPALIIGAGDLGASVIAQMKNASDLNILPVCIADDDSSKRGIRVHDVPVRGATDDIPSLVSRYDIDMIIYAIGSASDVDKRRILQICTRTGCELKIIPSVETMLEDSYGLGQMRDVDVGDLLARPQVQLNIDAVSSYLTGSCILVTGGGGSIGSELCRQIARFHPRKLIIFDIYENNAYELFVDLRRQYPDLDVQVVIGSIRDVRRLDDVFGKYQPDVVFHAAAHKHVPLMEDSPIEAIKNNVVGTSNVATAADRFEVKRFVLISTDKAVNPTNIMGASKYLCELVVQYMNQMSRGTDYVAVRFGNVLGSNGSVIPLFRRQIAAGGPVTVTHKDITRYFMTIPEAAQLVIQAGSMARQGEIFLLDMGEPVRIDDFARSFIRLSGFEPDVDIKIVYTGLRPGEKMYEELINTNEIRGKSDFPGILISKPHEVSAQEIKRRLDFIRRMAEEDPAHIRRYMSQVVPTYHYIAKQEDHPDSAMREENAGETGNAGVSRADRTA